MKKIIYVVISLPIVDGKFFPIDYACSTPKEAANFFDEINLMKSLGYHERLVNMIGCTTAHEPLCLIVEYCSGGDLHEYLRRKHDYMVEKQIAGIMIDPGFVSLDILLTFARQVACGMEYLSDKGFVHRDLAARNVLLDDIKNVKICDFGLCRTYNNENLYYTSRGGRLPIKWMALESISDYKFTTASDVWSFGILLFEIITLARCPYEGVDPCCMEEYLRRGKRMDKPINCPDELPNPPACSRMDNINKRLRTELQDMMGNKLKIVDNFSFNEKDAKEWSLRILPTGHPFNQAAFKLNITFPPEYPFKPPNIVFAKGAPFHPNIEPNGRMCFPTINPATWRANTRIRDVLLELDDMLTKPDPEHALRADAGKLFMEDKNAYEKRVEESIKEVGDPR